MKTKLRNPKTPKPQNPKTPFYAHVIEMHLTPICKNISNHCSFSNSKDIVYACRLILPNIDELICFSYNYEQKQHNKYICARFTGSS